MQLQVNFWYMPETRFYLVNVLKVIMAKFRWN